MLKLNVQPVDVEVLTFITLDYFESSFPAVDTGTMGGPS